MDYPDEIIIDIVPEKCGFCGVKSRYDYVEMIRAYLSKEYVCSKCRKPLEVIMESYRLTIADKDIILDEMLCMILDELIV